MPEMPTLGPQPKKSPVGPVLIVALVAGLLAGGIFMLRQKPEQPPANTPVASPVVPGRLELADGGTMVIAQLPASIQEKIALALQELKQKQPGPTDLDLAKLAASAQPPADPLAAAGLERVAVSIDGPLETALVTQLGKEVGEPLTQVVTRALVWWLQVPGDLRKGDQLEVLFKRRPNEEPQLWAVRLTSGKMGKTFEAIRFQPSGQKYAKLYELEGRELEERLQPTPIDEYEQITSLLRDGRKHKGVDFKAPVGTPVKATFAGTITRKNWSFRGNGNCLEVTEAGGKGRKAIYLHLAELPRSLSAGKRVSVGEVIAQSGNSGRSFAPHLHYQLMSAGDQVIDPFEHHQTVRDALPPEQLERFNAEAARLRALFTSPIADR